MVLTRFRDATKLNSALLTRNDLSNDKELEMLLHESIYLTKTYCSYFLEPPCQVRLFKCDPFEERVWGVWPSLGTLRKNIKKYFDKYKWCTITCQFGKGHNILYKTLLILISLRQRSISPSKSRTLLLQKTHSCWNSCSQNWAGLNSNKQAHFLQYCSGKKCHHWQ
jgi:hypothetical protein